jgi:tetratricopeptide (TPR) repeat protein
MGLLKPSSQFRWAPDSLFSQPQRGSGSVDPGLTAAHDDRHLVLTLEWLGYGGWWHGDLDAAEDPWTEGRAIARANGWASLEAEALVRLAMLASQRGDHERRSALLAEARSLAEQGPSRLTLAGVERAYGSFLAATSSDLEGEAMLRAAAGVLEEFGERQEWHTALIHLGDIERHRDNPAAALVLYRRGLELVLEHVGFRPEAQRRIAQALLELGELDEAAAQAEEAAAITGKDDWGTVASTGSVLGLVREAQGQAAEAERLLRDAVETISRTDFDSWFEELSLAEFLLRAG